MTSRDFRVLLHDPLTIRLHDGGARETLLEALDMRVSMCGFFIRVTNPDAEEWQLLKTIPGVRCESTPTAGGQWQCWVERDYIPLFVLEILDKHLAGGWQGATSQWYFVALGLLQGVCEKHEIYLR